MRWATGIILVSWLVFVGPAAWADVSPDTTLVLYNPAWTDGTHSGDYIADYYAAQRGIPLSNVVGITGLGTSEDISATDYLNTVFPQVQNALATRNINTIVTTKGLPLRIDNGLSNPDPNASGYTYTDTFGNQRQLYGDWWSPYSSLESELAGINLISSNRNSPNWLTAAQLQMGDQTFFNPSNPYYCATTSFSHSDPSLGGMYLTSRLDGFTVANVTASINKAKNAFVIPNGSCIVMDNDPNVDVADNEMVAALNTLRPKGPLYVYDNTSAAVTTAPGPVIGYDSHGIHGGGLNPGYIPNQLNFTLANGAVFTTHESFNAYSFQQGGNHNGQGLVAEWIAKGGTAGIGNVQEPMNGPENEANEDQMFQMLLSGYTWGEAAWSSLAQLSYVNTVVGDPLMTWKTLLPGDANMDGTVGSADLAILGANWGKTGQAGGAMWSLGDFNCDGVVGSADLALLGANWGKVASWATSSADVGSFSPQGVPEPSTIWLAIIGLTTLLASYRWRHR
jgi:uncharacterized protein (TIGR03790 family)